MMLEDVHKDVSVQSLCVAIKNTTIKKIQYYIQKAAIIHSPLTNSSVRTDTLDFRRQSSQNRPGMTINLSGRLIGFLTFATVSMIEPDGLFIRKMMRDIPGIVVNYER